VLPAAESVVWDDTRSIVERPRLRGVRTIPEGVHFVIEKILVQSPQSQKYFCGDECIGNPPSPLSSRRFAESSSSRRWSDPSRR
jgi:hypothetical protein